MTTDPATTPATANQEVFAETITELARENSDMLVVTSDSRGSGKLVPFGEAFPDQIIEVGIAEQNLVGIAAGLASTGAHVFAVSPAPFLTARSLEQIKNDVCYSDHPVTLVGISAGVSYGALGTTHHSIHDIAALRAINNIRIVVPADAAETRMVVRAAAAAGEPVYLRLGKRPVPALPGTVTEASVFHRARRLCNGSDAALLACGEAVAPALAAAERLAAENIKASVHSVPCIRPIDTNSILDAARNASAVVTVEEHSVHGGLGEACAALLLHHGIHKPFRIIGFPDEVMVNGSQQEIFEHYGLTKDGIVAVTRQLLADS